LLTRGEPSSTVRDCEVPTGGEGSRDVKKLARIPKGGGHRALGRGHAHPSHRGLGYDYVHAAVDEHSRLAYAEIHPDETGPSCAAFLHRAGEFFASHGVTVERVMTDNALDYRKAKVFHDLDRMKEGSTP
jgi:hypothetical protein